MNSLGCARIKLFYFKEVGFCHDWKTFFARRWDCFRLRPPTERRPPPPWPRTQTLTLTVTQSHAWLASVPWARCAWKSSIININSCCAGTSKEKFDCAGRPTRDRQPAAWLVIAFVPLSRTQCAATIVLWCPPYCEKVICTPGCATFQIHPPHPQHPPLGEST